MVLQIVGNEPGLQNAVEMWAGEFAGFLRDFGFTQMITDRRRFHLTDKGGLLLIVGTFSDDLKVVVKSEIQGGRVHQSLEQEVPRSLRRRGDRAQLPRAQIHARRVGDHDQLQQGHGRSRRETAGKN